MSMVTILVFATDAEIAGLLANPDGIEAFIGKERTSTDLDKAWHGLHWLLTGTEYGGKEPLCFLLAGGRPIGDVDVGYGPARAISSNEVVAWDDALKQISGDELSRRFDPKAMLKAKIYPEIWARSLKGEEDTLAYLLEYYATLKQFVVAARKEQSGLLVYLG